jgi:hypothetical protein
MPTANPLNRTRSRDDSPCRKPPAVLEEDRGPEAEIHYTEWFELAEGLRPWAELCHRG